MDALPLTTHLTELRKRLLLTLCLLGLIFVPCFYYAEVLFDFLCLPLKRVSPASSMIYTSLPEAFTTYIKMAFFASLFITLPFLLYHLWRFIMPGLLNHEKPLFRGFIVFGPLFFYGGGLFAYALVLPLAWRFFAHFQGALPSGQTLELLARMSEYLSLTMGMMLAFGFCFQMPLVLILLVRSGIIKLQSLRSKRRHIYLILLTLSALLTPPDVTSMLALGGPLLLLFEGAIVYLHFFAKKID